MFAAFVGFSAWLGISYLQAEKIEENTIEHDYTEQQASFFRKIGAIIISYIFYKCYCGYCNYTKSANSTAKDCLSRKFDNTTFLAHEKKELKKKNREAGKQRKRI